MKKNPCQFSRLIIPIGSAHPMCTSTQMLSKKCNITITSIMFVTTSTYMCIVRVYSMCISVCLHYISHSSCCSSVMVFSLVKIVKCLEFAQKLSTKCTAQSVSPCAQSVSPQNTLCLFSLQYTSCVHVS